MEKLKIIAFTHKTYELEKVGTLHIEEDNQQERLSAVKALFQIDELLFLSTCNRVEFVYVSNDDCDTKFLEQFILHLYPHLSDEVQQHFVDSATVYEGAEAISHLLRVAASIDSMVVGEREIITQVRNAYNLCHKMNLTGDFLRILIQHTIETAKKVYTQTNIATKPVSIVSLAYHRLRDLNISLDARFLLVGAGATNINMSRFLKKHGFTNFVVFNRTLSKAEKLAKDLGGKAFPLNEISNYTGGFDVIMTCTGAESHVIDRDLYIQLLQGETTKKIVIDLSIPNDLDPKIVEEFGVKHISVEYLREISAENQKERSKEIHKVEAIIKDEFQRFIAQNRLRQVEIAMREVPEKVKEIKSLALNTIFAQDIANLNPEAREILEKVMSFVEKKYISVPMKMAKEILVRS